MKNPDERIMMDWATNHGIADDDLCHLIQPNKIYTEKYRSKYES